MKFNFGITAAILLGSSAAAKQLRGQRELGLGPDVSEYTSLVHVDFNDLKAGDILSRKTYKGMTIFSQDDDNHPVMIFDSSNPTGNDTDLRDKDDCGLGMMAIISEDADASDPNDSKYGGFISARFDKPVVMEHIGIMDNEEGVLIKLYDPEGIIHTIEAPKGESGNFATTWLKRTKVERIKIECTASCAIPFITYSTLPEACPDPAPALAPEGKCEIVVDQRIRVESEEPLDLSWGWDSTTNLDVGGPVLAAPGDTVVVTYVVKIREGPVTDM